MGLPSHVNHRSDLNESMKKPAIRSSDTLCSIMKDELIVSDDSDFIDVCTRGTKNKDLFYSQNNVKEIEDITINSGEANKDFFVGKCDSDAKNTMSNNSTIDHVNTDEKVSEQSQLCLTCGITTNELMNQTKLCKAKKSFTCSACSFKCCSKNNLEHHMQNNHKISIKCAVTLKLRKKKMYKSMIDSPNEGSPQNFSKIDRKKDIELYCVKCDKISRPKSVCKQGTCGLCNTCLCYQCKLCKKRCTHRRSTMYNHLKNECNIEPQYTCRQCDYKAKQKHHLQVHVQRKHSIIKCDFCYYKTMSKLQLNEHVRLNHNHKYRCSQCGKKYMQLKSFNNHKKNLCGTELYFECNHCSYSTNVKFSLKKHMQSRHSEIFLFGDSL